MLYIIEAEYQRSYKEPMFYVGGDGDDLITNINRARLYYTENSVEQRVAEYRKMYPNHRVRYRHVNIVIDETIEEEE